MASWRRDARVAACADAILGRPRTANAYARYFEAQLRRARFRAWTCHCLLVSARILRACCGLGRGEPWTRASRPSARE